MSVYMTKEQEKKLRETYRFHHCKRFHSMNAAIKTADDGFHFYSYYTWCVSWYPSCNILEVAPIVHDDGYALSPTTTRQVNRFLHEYVAPNVDVSALQYGKVVRKIGEEYHIGRVQVMYRYNSNRLSI